MFVGQLLVHIQGVLDALKRTCAIEKRRTRCL